MFHMRRPSQAARLAPLQLPGGAVSSAPRRTQTQAISLDICVGALRDRMQEQLNGELGVASSGGGASQALMKLRRQMNFGRRNSSLKGSLLRS